MRKHRASSLEGFVFRSAGAAGRGGEPEAHVLEVDAAPLLVKRGRRSANGETGSDAGKLGSAVLRLGVSCCYENFCLEPMRYLQASSQTMAGCLTPQWLSSMKPTCCLPQPSESSSTPWNAPPQEAHLRKPLDLLLSPFCAMQPAHDHPTFKWPRNAAQRFAASAAAVSQMHAAKLGVAVVACHHTGAGCTTLQHPGAIFL